MLIVLRILETHYKSSIVMGSFFLTTLGWFAWSAFLDGVFAKTPSGTYSIRDSFTGLYGVDGAWWATIFIVLGFLGMFETVVRLIKRNLIVAGYWTWPPWKGRKLNCCLEELDLEVWQEMEQDPVMFRQLCAMAREGELEYVEEDEPAEEKKPAKARVITQLGAKLGLRKA